MHRRTLVALTLFLTATQPLAAQVTQQDMEAEAEETVNPSTEDIVEPAGPAGSPEAAEAEGDTSSALEQARTMLDDMTGVVQSIRSKSEMPSDPLSHLDSILEVHFVKLSSITVKSDLSELSADEKLRDYDEGISNAQAHIGKNEYVMNALHNRGYELQDVVTWETGGTADVLIVVDDRDKGE
ncbi:hypothetical protein E0K89_015635 [Aquicoccus sp. SCR17]|nr:hypothetical protein [Carideicomes alvinocaridis]